MPSRETANEIEDAAVDWAVRAERGLAVSEREDLDRWLEGDSRRLGAFVRAQAVWVHAERASALGGMPESREELDANATADAVLPASQRLSRRMMLGGGTAAAASLGAAYLLGSSGTRTLESGVGEIRRIRLAGGTTLVLDTDTRVDVDTSSNDRLLDLVRGKLFLVVARTIADPLTVRIGNLTLATAEGAFSLQGLRDSPLVALVTGGRLTASQSQGLFLGRHSVSIDKDHALYLSRRGELAADSVRPVADAERERLLAWRDGMLSFGGEFLGTAVRSFDRYGAIRIIVADPALARERVTGLFKASDPRGFAIAVAASFGAVVTSEGDTIRLSAKKFTSA